MHAIEFVTKIDNGIVQVPKEYKELQQAGKARIIILFDEGQEPPTTLTGMLKKTLTPLSLKRVEIKTNGL